MTSNDEREAFNTYAIDRKLLHIGKDNLATCVQNLGVHREDFMAGYQAALASLPRVTEGELVLLIDTEIDQADCDPEQNLSSYGEVVTRAILSRFPQLKKGD